MWQQRRLEMVLTSQTHSIVWEASWNLRQPYKTGIQKKQHSQLNDFSNSNNDVHDAMLHITGVVCIFDNDTALVTGSSRWHSANYTSVLLAHPTYKNKPNQTDGSLKSDTKQCKNGPKKFQDHFLLPQAKHWCTDSRQKDAHLFREKPKTAHSILTQSNRCLSEDY